MKMTYPNFGWVGSETASIGSRLTKETLAILETTRGRWKPKLDALCGLVQGADFHLVFSPELVLTWRVLEELKKYPKLIWGRSALGAHIAQDFCQAVLDLGLLMVWLTR
jgi:UDP-N-acetyl-D-mannosaminuronate dehydrogenase